jgi:hypothetical protein
VCPSKMYRKTVTLWIKYCQAMKLNALTRLCSGDSYCRRKYIALKRDEKQVYYRLEVSKQIHKGRNEKM